MIESTPIEISACQPEYSNEKYCTALPSAGRTIVVFDLSSPSVRDLPVEIRILKDSLVPFSHGSEGAAVLEIFSTQKSRKHKILSIDHTFEGGQLMVSLIGARGERSTAEFKFSAGQTFFGLLRWLLGGALLLGLFVFYWQHNARRPKPSAAAK